MALQERRSHAAGEDSELDTLVRHVALADWLVLVVVVLYEVVTPEHAFATPVVVAIALFAVVSTALRVPRLIGARPRLALAIATWSMTAFVTVIAWFTGGIDSPLQGLYLLPIVLASLVFSIPRLTLQLVAIAAAYLLIAGLRPGANLTPVALAGRVLAGLGPLLVVAWLTSQLGTAVLSARRRAAALTDGDALTGLATRRLLLERLKHELTDEERRDQPCGLVIVDLEGSRRLNEQYGHDAGNAALKLVAEALRRTLRETDIAARWGGDEFAVLLAGADLNSAQVAGQRIRHAVHTTTLDAGTRLVRCAVSVGIAAAPRDGRDPVAVVASAERRLERDRELRRKSSVATLPGQAAG
jgi:diguanylate cyclase (GGDEF)-like protein